ncbi:16S rRNA (uracil(1498)-N(3))-methyltransferase [Winogradskyella sp. 3972H.M.0a.05]|uniref:16S rRNA (uracil(1498)-N(3))-methyltransferase n=1 Tax=Winogradskyella sp. 3972H.M.0a.05 TaxID=2950277 RepID=UPI00339B4C26
MQLFYNPNISDTDTQILFPKEESRHIVKVLRKSSGDVLLITNGKGWLFEAKITMADLKRCTAEIVSKTYHENRNYKLHLAVAPTKMNDRYEWFLEKATEIGINTITPIICQNSERKVIKKERFEKIIQSAMKQSLQYHLPTLNDAIAFKSFLNQKFEGQTFIAHCEDTDRKSLKQELTTSEEIIILIGPEGDFSSEEIALALQKGFTAVTLGDTRLRTETAAIAACHSVAFSNQS